jgi:hypothetical protein
VPFICRQIQGDGPKCAHQEAGKYNYKWWKKLNKEEREENEERMTERNGRESKLNSFRP